MYLFGSRARGDPTSPSDIDVFVETEAELEAIPQHLVMVNDGPIDAFWMPNADGWADAIGTGQERQLLVDSSTQREARPISVKNVLHLALSIDWDPESYRHTKVAPVVVCTPPF